MQSKADPKRCMIFDAAGATYLGFGNSVSGTEEEFTEQNSVCVLWKKGNSSSAIAK